MLESTREVRPHRTIEVTSLWGSSILNVVTSEREVTFGVDIEAPEGVEPFSLARQEASGWVVTAPASYRAWVECESGWTLLSKDSREYVLSSGETLFVAVDDLLYSLKLAPSTGALASADRDARWPAALLMAFLLHLLVFNGLFYTPSNKPHPFAEEHMIAALHIEPPPPPLANEARLAKRAMPGGGVERRGAEGTPYAVGRPMGYGTRNGSRGVDPRGEGLARGESVADRLGLRALDKNAGLFGTRGADRELETALAGVIVQPRTAEEALSNDTAKDTPGARIERAPGEMSARSSTWRDKRRYEEIDEGLAKTDVEALRLRAGEPVASGIDMEAVRRTIARKLDEVRYCHEKSNAQELGVFGTVRVEIVIELGGNVSSAELIESNIDNEDVTRCILGRVKRWSFPKPEGTRAVVRVPFLLNRVG